MKYKNKSLLTLFLISTIFALTINTSNSSYGSLQTHSITLTQLQTFESNADFAGLPGNGSETDPYFLQNLVLTGGTPTENVIQITDTDAYLVIKNNTISGGLNGIFLDRVKNVYILNNTIHGNYENGIQFFHSNNTRVEDNEIYDNGSGCNPRPNLNQIRLLGHIGSGVHYDPSEDSTVVNNNIYGNYIAGITIEDGTNITIQGNEINDNGNICTLFNNLNLNVVDIEDPDGFGINLFDVENIIITKNEISGNANYGVISRSDSLSVEVKENNFLGNNLDYGSGRKQALDNGTSNIYDSNYWDDLGVASVYDLDGDQNNQDLNPKNAENIVTFSQTEFIPRTAQTTSEKADDDGLVLSLPSVIVALSLAVIFIRFHFRTKRT